MQPHSAQELTPSRRPAVAYRRGAVLFSAPEGALYTYHQKRMIAGYVFISPWVIGFLVFVVGSLLASLFLSFTNWNALSKPQIIGFKNYAKLFFDDPLFWKSVKVTALYSLSIPLNLVFGLLIAVLLNQKIKGLGIFRTIYYLPSVIVGVAVSLLWVWIFNPRFGVFNLFLAQVFGIKGPAWLADETWVIPALIIMSLWGVGGPMLIYLAALQNVPTSYYEAAIVDGANAWQRFVRITVPMISPVILFNLIMGIIQSFQVFTPAYVMTEGGPNHASLVYVLYLYRHAFQWYRMGYAAAQAWILFVLILGMTLIVMRSSAVWVYYESRK